MFSMLSEIRIRNSYILDLLVCASLGSKAATETTQVGKSNLLDFAVVCR